MKNFTLTWMNKQNFLNGVKYKYWILAKKHKCKTVDTFEIQIYLERNTQVCYSFEEILSKHEGKGKEETKAKGDRKKAGESRLAVRFAKLKFP